MGASRGPCARHWQLDGREGRGGSHLLPQCSHGADAVGGPPGVSTPAASAAATASPAAASADPSSSSALVGGGGSGSGSSSGGASASAVVPRAAVKKAAAAAASEPQTIDERLSARARKFIAARRQEKTRSQPSAYAKKKTAGLLKHPGGTPASALPAAKGGAPPPLPQGWSSAVDPGSGKEYFYSSSGETVWERPTQ
jgi:hypothetical protein